MNRAFPVLVVILALVVESLEAQAVCPCDFVVNQGVLHVEDLTTPVTELYGSADGIIDQGTPYVILSWTLLEAPHRLEPTVVTQVAWPLFEAGAAWAALDTGATWYPDDRYRPQITAGPFVGLDLPIRGLHTYGLLSLRPFQDWTWTLNVGAGYTFHSRER